MSDRIKQVNELIKQEAAKGLKAVGVEGFITVKAVETDPDMKNAAVWVSVLAGDEEEALKEVESKRHQVQQLINKKMTSRNVPAINFRLDHSGEYAQRIEELLKNDSDRN